MTPVCASRLTGHKCIVMSVRSVDEELSLVMTTDSSGLFKLWSVAASSLGFAPCLHTFTSHPLHPIVPKCVARCRRLARAREWCCNLVVRVRTQAVHLTGLQLLWVRNGTFSSAAQDSTGFSWFPRPRRSLQFMLCTAGAHACAQFEEFLTEIHIQVNAGVHHCTRTRCARVVRI